MPTAPKAKASSPHMKFVSCAIGSRERIWFIAEEDDDSRLLQLRGDAWLARTPDWAIAAVTGRVAGGKFEVVAVGADGELLIGIPGSFSESRIVRERGRKPLGVLRDARWIGNDVFVAGMSRQVYRRTRGRWLDVATTIRANPSEALGFNSIDGTKESDVYAVGFGGEIWHYDGTTWEKRESPTAVALQKVCAAGKGVYYACGQSGVLLRGGARGFELVEHASTRDNLYGLAVFKGVLYVASLTQVWRLVANRLEPVDLGGSGRLTCGVLEAGDGMLWSVGARHLLRSKDGVSWQRVSCDV